MQEERLQSPMTLPEHDVAGAGAGGAADLAGDEDIEHMQGRRGDGVADRGEHRSDVSERGKGGYCRSGSCLTGSSLGRHPVRDCDVPI